MRHFLRRLLAYNYLQFTPRAGLFCERALKDSGADALLRLPSRYMQLVLCGAHCGGRWGAVLAAAAISLLSLVCSIGIDIVQLLTSSAWLSMAGKFLCCIVFFFQFDLGWRTGNRKKLMLLYCLFLMAFESSMVVSLGVFILFERLCFSNITKEDSQ